MSQTPELPAWVSYVQACTVPVIAAAGVLITMAQMVIARDRFEIDTFDRQYTRRVAVYEATREFLEAAIRETLSERDIRAYGMQTLDAQFLFNAAMYKYLRELCWRVAARFDAKSSIGKLPPGVDREIKERDSAVHLDWIIKQGDEASGFATRFRPFLVFEQRERPWLLRLFRL